MPTRRRADQPEGGEEVVRGGPESLVEAGRRLAARSRREQGLPETIIDPATIKRVAVLLGGEEDGQARQVRPTRSGLNWLRAPVAGARVTRSSTAETMA